MKRKMVVLFLIFALLLTACIKKEELVHKTEGIYESAIAKETSNEELQSNYLFSFKGKYRYKNSYESIVLNFNNIELISEYKGVLPDREAFLIFDIHCRLTMMPKSNIINLPDLIQGPNIDYKKIVGADKLRAFSEYQSLNSFLGFYTSLSGEEVHLPTEINVDYGYIAEEVKSRNTGYVTTSLGSITNRVIICDVFKKDVLDPSSYLVFDPHGKPGEEIEHPKRKIFFTEFIKDSTN